MTQTHKHIISQQPHETIQQFQKEKTMALVSSSTSPFPSSGRELLLELKRTGGGSMASSSSTSGSYLPPYNIKLVRKCFQDLQGSFQSLQEEMAALEYGRPQEEEDEDEEDE